MAKKVIQPASDSADSLRPFEQFAPFGVLGKKKILTIPWQDIRPTIRWLKGNRMSDRGISHRIIFDYLLVFFLDGAGKYVVGKEEIDVQKRHLFLVSPFTLNRFMLKGSHFFTSIHFDWKPNFPPTSPGLGRQPYQVRFPLNVQIPPHQVLTAGDPLVIQLQHILELWQKGTELSRLHANALLFEILVTLLERAEMKKMSVSVHQVHTDQRRVEIALAFMQERLAENVSPHEMAREAGLSAGHFSHIFRKWTGHSPMEHLIKIRIQKAKELLEDIHLTIKEVSNSSGFQHSSYFSKIFTRFTGVSPSQYREMILAQRSP